MKKLLARLLGHDPQIRQLEHELHAERGRRRQVEAQRDANREGWEISAQATNIHAKQKQDLAELIDARLNTQQEAAELVRSAHRQLNLNGGTRRAQQQVLQAARLLEGDN